MPENKGLKKIPPERMPVEPKLFAPRPFEPGNGWGAKTSRFKSTMFQAVTHEDVKDVTKMLIRKAKAGDLIAAKLFLQYVCGNPDKMEDAESITVNMERLTAAEKLELLEKL